MLTSGTSSPVRDVGLRRAWVTLEKVLFTVSDYHKMAEAGILPEGDRVELIEGEIVRMNPTGSRHAACVRRVDTFLNRTADLGAIVSVQSPILLPDLSEPEPDVALLRPRADFYAEGHPQPDDVLLLIEVSDTTLDYDRNVKLPLYARFGIPETWIVDLGSDMIETHSGPAGGIYRDIKLVGRGESLSPRTVPGFELDAGAILP